MSTGGRKDGKGWLTRVFDDKNYGMLEAAIESRQEYQHAMIPRILGRPGTLLASSFIQNSRSCNSEAVYSLPRRRGTWMSQTQKITIEGGGTV